MKDDRIRIERSVEKFSKYVELIVLIIFAVFMIVLALGVLFAIIRAIF